MKQFNVRTVAVAVVLAAAVVVSLFSAWRVSSVIDDVDRVLQPVEGYLPVELQEDLARLREEWQELRPVVKGLEDLIAGFDILEAQGSTGFDRLSLSDTSTSAILTVNQAGTGAILDLQDGGTTVWQVADGGVQSFEGNCIDLDADDDTSVCADTDDQVDWEIGGADVQVWTDFGASNITTDTTKYLVEILDSTPVMTAGTNSLAFLNIDAGIGNSTAGTNTVFGLLIDGISQDAQNTETGIQIGNGWDRGLDLDGNSLYMDNDQDSYFSELADDSIGFTPGAATGSLEVRSGNLQVGDGAPGETHDGEDFYVEGISEFDGAAYFDGAVDFDAGVVAAEDVENTMLPTLVSTIWIVHDVYVNVTTNFDTTGDDATLVIGDGNDADGWCVLADTELQTADVEGTGWQAGWQCQVAATIGVYGDESNGFVYAPSGAAETIDYLIDETSGETLTAGAATIYVWYTRIQ
jgi:hypothetical protein